MFPASKSATLHTAPLLRRLCVAVVALAALGAVTGCSETKNWTPVQAAHRNEVRYITFEHEVRFANASTVLGQTEESRLNTFLARIDVGYGDQVFVGAQGNRNGNGAALRAGRREAAVQSLLRGRNIAPQMLGDTGKTGGRDNTVKIVIGRYVVVPPRCPDWSKEAKADYGNTPSSNFGCATETNLGLMVANPADLVRGTPPGPADGAVGARRYHDYREGKQQELSTVTPLVIQSGAGGN